MTHTPFSDAQRGSALRGLLVFLSIIITTILGVAYTFGYVVPPGMMGVREVVIGFQFGPPQGFSTKGLAPGYHWSIPFYSTVHLIPQTLQVITINGAGATGGNESGSLEIQTEDGSSVFVESSILFRFAEEPQDGSGGPRDLLTKLKVDPDRWVNQIVQDSSNRLKFRLGSLTTSEFYDPDHRQKMLDEALSDIRERLKPYGILVEGVLLRRYRYREEIDNAIFQKNLQEQEKSLNAAKGQLAKASALLKEVSAAEDAKIKTLEVEGENKVRVIRSEGDLSRAKRSAEGDLLVAQAKAEVDKQRAGALAAGRGATVYVGRELAPMISSLKGGTISGLDPYDLQTWLKRLGVQE